MSLSLSLRIYLLENYMIVILFKFEINSNLRLGLSVISILRFKL